MMEEITVNEFGWESEIKSSHPYFHPTRHIPWINANGDMNISPVETKTFCVCKSQQNIQKIKNTSGMNTYVLKYIGKMDEVNYVIVKANAHKKIIYKWKLHFFIIQKWQDQLGMRKKH